MLFMKQNLKGDAHQTLVGPLHGDARSGSNVEIRNITLMIATGLYICMHYLIN